MKRLQTALGALLLGLSVGSPLLWGAEPSVGIDWRPATFDAFEFDRRFAQELLNRGFSELASGELARLEAKIETAPTPERLRFGATAVRAALETSRLETAADRAEVAEKIAELRTRLNVAAELDAALNDGNQDVANAALEFEAASVRALFELGVLENELGSESETPQTAESQYLAEALETSKTLVRRLDPGAARPFVYWAAKITLAQPVDAAAFATAENAATALENASKNRRDEFYFLAKLLQIESARLQNDAQTAAARLDETTAALDGAEPDVAAAVRVALDADRIRLAALTGAAADAARLALDDGGAATAFANSPQIGAFFDPVATKNFACAEFFWNAATAPETTESVETQDVAVDKTAAFVDAGKIAASRLSANFWRTRAARLVRDAAQKSGGDWRTTEAAAEANFRRDLWETAIADFDRAATEATASGDDADAFRLGGASAAIVDKILRDKIFKRGVLTENSPEFWRAEAVRRFDALARSRPSDPTAPRLYLLALDYSENADGAEPTFDAARRLDYLRLFPAAKNRGAFAVDGARRALAQNRLDDAAAFLDFVEPTDSAPGAALETERRLAAARLAQTVENAGVGNGVFADVVRRFLTKTTAGKDAFSDGTPGTPLETALSETAQNLTPETFSSADSAVLTALFETVLSTEFLKDETLNVAFETLLNRWENAVSESGDSETAARIGSFRLAVLLDANRTEDVLRRVADVERAAPESAAETLERLLELAENSGPETRRTIGNFVLSALDLRQNAPTGQVGQNGQTAADRRDLLRARALRFAGKAQESLTLFANLRRKNPKNVAAVRGIAQILSERSDEKTLELALKYWSDVADLVPLESIDWWNAKERCVEIYVKLGRKDQAEKMTKTIWLTRSDPRDPGRRARWERLCR